MAKINNQPPKAPLWPWGGPRSVREKLVDPSQINRGKKVKKGNAANPIESSATRKGINIYAKAGSPVIAVQDGRIIKIGNDDRLGKFIMLRDAYGNTYTYGRLKKLAHKYPVPKSQSVTQSQVDKELKLSKDPKPTAPASAGSQAPAKLEQTAQK